MNEYVRPLLLNCRVYRAVDLLIDEAVVVLLVRPRWTLEHRDLVGEGPMDRLL